MITTPIRYVGDHGSATESPHSEAGKVAGCRDQSDQLRKSGQQSLIRYFTRPALMRLDTSLFIDTTRHTASPLLHKTRLK